MIPSLFRLVSTRDVPTARLPENSDINKPFRMLRAEGDDGMLVHLNSYSEL